MDYLIVIILIVDIALDVHILKHFCNKTGKKTAPDNETMQNQKKDKREKQMRNFLGYTGDKQ